MSTCYVCRRLKVESPGEVVIRIYSGIYGGGYPACRDHTITAETDALAPLKDKDIVDGYTVTAYSVHEGLTARRLWTATRMKSAPTIENQLVVEAPLS